jgi:site-specific recombinase XerC
MTGLKREGLALGIGAHLRVIGKGRRERYTPLAKATRAVLKAWLGLNAAQTTLGAVAQLTGAQLK